ncbi:hypothetical protein [Streptomyces sp. NPDC004296]
MGIGIALVAGMLPSLWWWRKPWSLGSLRREVTEDGEFAGGSLTVRGRR